MIVNVNNMQIVRIFYLFKVNDLSTASELW